MKQKDKYKHLSFDEKETLFIWFSSQQKWHMRQPPSDWHRNQAQWYKNNSRWLFTFEEIIKRTFYAKRQALVDNITKTNILLARLTLCGKNNYERQTS